MTVHQPDLWQGIGVSGGTAGGGDHAGLNDPVTGPFKLSGLTRPPPGRARVFLDKRGQMRTVMPSTALHWSQGRFGQWRAYYEGDIAEHPLELSLRLPSATDALEFDCEVRLVWWVHEPEAAVTASLHDVRTRVRMELERRARPITWQLAPEKSSEVERRLNQALGTGPLQLAPGINVSDLYVAVTPPRQHIAGVEQDVQQGFEIRRIQRRYGFYRERFAEGHEALLALSIQDQSDVGTIVNMLMDHGQQRATRSLETFKAMLETGRIEDQDLEDIRRVTLENLVSLLQHRLVVSAPQLPGPAPGTGQ